MKFEMLTYNFSKIFDVKTVGPEHFAKRPYSHMEPFDLDFPLKKRSDLDTLMRGPGVYQIFFKDKLVYIGKFDTLNAGNVADERWRKHLETITLRGNRLGFKSPKAVDELIDLMDNEKLRKALTAEKTRLKERLRDTGVVSSRNRMAFANKNWSTFSKLSDTSLKQLFTVDYYRFTHIKTVPKATDSANKLERALIKQYRPECNRECSKKNPSEEATVHHARKTTISQIKKLLS